MLYAPILAYLLSLSSLTLGSRIQTQARIDMMIVLDPRKAPFVLLLFQI